MAEKPLGARGRPRLHLEDDPDRYAIAALPALMIKFHLVERSAAIVAAKFMGSSKSPETIRWKTRKYWLDAGESYTLFHNYLGYKRYGEHEFSSHLIKNISAELIWLRNAAEAILLAFEGGSVRRHQMESLSTINTLMQKKGDLNFIKKYLLSALAKDEQVIDFIRKNCP